MDSKGNSSIIGGSKQQKSPHNTAYLYKSCAVSSLENEWTHILPWEASALIDLTCCPVSGESVGMVCDGSVVAARKEDVSNGVVRFRYGKKTYQLSTAIGSSSRSSNAIDSDLSCQRGRVWLQSWWYGTTSTEARNANADTKTATTSSTIGSHLSIPAQDRIAEALDLESLKILHKGILLYDSKTRRGIVSDLLSQALLKISKDDWQKPKKKSTLVVMGTPKKDTLKEPSAVANDAARTSGLANRIRLGLLRTLEFSMNLLGWSWKLPYYFVLSVLEPFWPLLGWNRNRDDGGERPHRD